MRVLISAGEASGDAYGAALLEALRKHGDVSAEALGGHRLGAAGARMVADSSAWGAIGVAEAIRVLPQARSGLRKMRSALAAGSPGVFVPIDYGYFNIRLAGFAKDRGWRVLYFSPPGAWRRDRQGADLPHATDAVVTPFSWSAEILNRMGANAHWFGHPIKQMIRDASKGDEWTGERSALAVLPGSRASEVGLLLPVIAKALKGLETPAEIAVAASLDTDRVRNTWKRLAPERIHDSFAFDDTFGVLRRARAAIVCSGTATLEAALCRCPHVIVYRVSKLVELQAKLVRFKVPLIGQPNILLERMVAKELVQHGATPEAIRMEVDRLLGDDSAKKEQLKAFDELDGLLGPDDAIDRSAELIWKLAG
jgi:lipid-A-disaccharide synthase